MILVWQYPPWQRPIIARQRYFTPVTVPAPGTLLMAWENFRFGYGFTAAEDLPVVRILPDQLRLFLRGFIPKNREPPSERLKIRSFLQILLFPHQAYHLPGNGDRAGKPRGFDPHKIDCVRGRIRPPFDDKIMIASHFFGRKLGTDPCKIPDKIFLLQIRIDAAAGPGSADP